MATTQRRSGRARTQVASYAEEDLAGDASFIVPAPASQPRKNKKKINLSPALPFTSVKGPMAPETKSRLLALPAELRNHIYELVLDSGEIVPINAVKAPSLPLACKQIFTETLQLYYANILFMARDDERLRRWVQNLGASRASLVRNVCFEYEYICRIVLIGNELRDDMQKLRDELEEKDVVLWDDVIRVRTYRTGTVLLTLAQAQDGDELRP